LLNDYLDEARHAADTEGAPFRPVSNDRTGEFDNTITPDGVYKLVRRYALALGLKIGAHALRASAAPMRWIRTPTSPRSRNGPDTPILQLQRYTAIVGRTARCGPIAGHQSVLLQIVTPSDAVVCDPCNSDCVCRRRWRGVLVDCYQTERSS